MLYDISDEYGKKIADALGIKNCRDLKIHFPVKGIVKVTAEFYPEEDGVKVIEAVMKEFELCPKEGQ